MYTNQTSIHIITKVLTLMSEDFFSKFQRGHLLENKLKGVHNQIS